MRIRGINKADFDFIVSVLDRWFGGASAERAHPSLFYELGRDALVAEIDGDVVGFLLGFVGEADEPVGYVHLVGIHPEHRRRGVGQGLYQQFTERCKTAGVRRLKAITAPGDSGSIEFHRSQGFDVQEIEDYAGPGRPRIVFTKAL